MMMSLRLENFAKSFWIFDAVEITAAGEGRVTYLFGFTWWWTGVLTTPNTLRRSRLYLKRIALF